ncbi:retrotransposon protein, putative, ty1-copia subclass [Tanacetum coccineum]
MVDLEMMKPQSDIIHIHSSKARLPTDRMCLYIDAEEHESGDLGEPANYKVVLLDPESDKWLNAMNLEMQSMKDNKVWVLVELPPNGKTVGSKWLFKKKTDLDGAVHTYKARLVAKGYTQTPRIDYEETFSPVAAIRAYWILIAIAAYYDYEIWQMDVKTASSMDNLNEEVYMEQPEVQNDDEPVSLVIGRVPSKDFRYFICRSLVYCLPFDASKEKRYGLAIAIANEFGITNMLDISMLKFTTFVKLLTITVTLS